MIHSLPYRFGVGMMLVNQAGQVFVGQRIDTTSDAWQMPQGGIDEGEDDITAAFRELEEEVGTNKATIIATSKEWLTYDLPDEIQAKIWKGKYRGQKQRWFLMRFDGNDNDINITTEHPEFDKWQWVNPESLVELIVPFKRDLYQLIVDEFKPLIDQASNDS